jgi:hypothetical protein
MTVILAPQGGGASNSVKVSTCDTAGDFTNENSGANINGTDDDFVEGTGAIGDKMSNTTEILASDNLSGGATGVYNFSSGGANEGWHFIGWVNVKTPFNATTGIQSYFKNASGHLGYWNNMPTYFYKGGFTTRVINPELDFTGATTWTTNGNPAQLDDVSIMGFRITTTSSIMGSFNNVQCDSFTCGLGLRAHAGTSGNRNNFEDMRVFDEDTNFHGWLLGNTAKGGLYIGPETGTTADYWESINEAIVFEDEQVAVGFYVVSIRGANTTCDFTLANISARNATNARWSFLVESTTGDTTGGVTDTNGVFAGVDQCTLNGNTTFTGTTIIDSTLITQLGSTLNGISVLNPNVTTSSAAVLADNLTLITNSTFESSGGGHAVEYRPTGAGPFSVNWSNNQDSGYAGTDGSTGDETILIHPVTNSASVTINVINGSSTPTIMEHADYTGAFSLVVNPVTTLVNVKDNLGANLQNARVFLKASDGTGDLPFEESVTSISRSGTLATVSHTAHGLNTGEYVKLYGITDKTEDNAGAHQITYVDDNSYTYLTDDSGSTSYTGTITATGALIYGLTLASGNISSSRSLTNDQPLEGYARKSTAGAPRFKTFPLSGIVDNADGLTINIRMILDE